MLFSTILATSLFLASASPTLELIADEVVNDTMQRKQIPGMSVAIVLGTELLFAKGYGKASIEFDIAATPDTVYPLSSVSRMFAGLTAIKLAGSGCLDIDAPINNYLDEVPTDKHGIGVRHLLQHTHGLDDFYHSAEYAAETGKSMKTSHTSELIAWTLAQQLNDAPGEQWRYGVAGYVVLAEVMKNGCGTDYSELAQRHVFDPLGIKASFGGSEIVVPGRNGLMYELRNNEVAGHVVDFPSMSWAAGGLNMSVMEFAKLFAALSGNNFLDEKQKRQLWQQVELADGEMSSYGLGWSSYETSRKRHVTGHEGGGASWVIYYPDVELAIIALSNMSGARADSLPYEIARSGFSKGLLPDPLAVSPSEL
jgi:CubicO group peptidase (beta-lactamase class C family)